jgi:serine/threonine protein kinase
MNISHRDIKPQNILVFKGRHGYKLADFGEAKELVTDPTNKQTLRGTELYMSPILFHALRARKVQKYINHNVFKSDVFSLGYCALFAAALTFEALYDIRELNNNYQIKMILEKYLKKHYSNKLIDVIAIMLEVDEKNRCDFIELEKVFENLNLED